MGEERLDRRGDAGRPPDLLSDAPPASHRAQAGRGPSLGDHPQRVVLREGARLG